MTNRVLLVDDETATLHSLSIVVQRVPGVGQVDAALHAGDALALAREHAYAVVMTDLWLPGQNGLDLLQTFAIRYPRTRRVLLADDAALRAESLSTSSLHAIVQKPWVSAQVEALVARLLDEAARDPAAGAERWPAGERRPPSGSHH